MFLIRGWREAERVYLFNRSGRVFSGFGHVHEVEAKRFEPAIPVKVAGLRRNEIARRLTQLSFSAFQFSAFACLSPPLSAEP